MSRGARLSRLVMGPAAEAVETLLDQQLKQDRSAVQLIERHAHPVRVDGADWLDTRPAQDLRNVTPTEADETEQALQYAAQRGLLVVHARQQHYVRVARRPL